jgi:hypothetical protein
MKAAFMMSCGCVMFFDSHLLCIWFTGYKFWWPILSLNKLITLWLTELCVVIFVTHLRINVFCGHMFIGVVIAYVFGHNSVVIGFCCIDSQICCLQTVLNVSFLFPVFELWGAVWISWFECMLDMLLSMHLICLSASTPLLMFFICIISCCALELIFVTFFQNARIVILLRCFSHVTWKSRSLIPEENGHWRYDWWLDRHYELIIVHCYR